MTNTTVNAILWDYDGTLVNSALKNIEITKQILLKVAPRLSGNDLPIFLKDEKIIKALTELIREVRVQLIGPIRQEILSGIKSQKRFFELKEYFFAFLDLNLEILQPGD